MAAGEGPPQVVDDGGGGGGLSSKMGPLPLWGWLLAGAGIFAVVWYMRGRSSSASVAPVVDTTGGAPPGDNSAAGGNAPVPDPNGNTLQALLMAMQAQTAALLADINKGSNTNSGNSSAGGNGGAGTGAQSYGDGLTAAQRQLLQENIDFYKKTRSPDEINAMIDASTGPGAPRGVIAQSQGVDYLQNGFVLPTYPGGKGGPRLPQVHILNRMKKRKPIRKLGSDVLALLNLTGTDVVALTSSHTSGGDATQQVSASPASPQGVSLTGAPLSGIGYTAGGTGGNPAYTYAGSSSGGGGGAPPGSRGPV